MNAVLLQQAPSPGIPDPFSSVQQAWVSARCLTFHADQRTCWSANLSLCPSFRYERQRAHRAPGGREDALAIARGDRDQRGIARSGWGEIAAAKGHYVGFGDVGKVRHPVAG